MLALVLGIIKQILLAFVSSPRTQRLIIDLLRALAKQTQNTLDDNAVDCIEVALFPPPPPSVPTKPIVNPEDIVSETEEQEAE